MKALTRSIKDICEKDPPVWLSEDVLQEEKHDKQEKCEYRFYIGNISGTWPDPKTKIGRFGHSIYEKSFDQIEITFQEDEYDEELEKFNKAKKLFKSKLPELLKKQKGKYAVAIEDIILVGEKQEDLFKEIVKKYGNVTMYIGKIVDENDKSELELVPKFVV